MCVFFGSLVLWKELSHELSFLPPPVSPFSAPRFLQLNVLGEMDDNDEEGEEEEEDDEGDESGDEGGGGDVGSGAGAGGGAAPKDDAEIDELAAALGATSV